MNKYSAACLPNFWRTAVLSFFFIQLVALDQVAADILEEPRVFNKISNVKCPDPTVQKLLTYMYHDLLIQAGEVPYGLRKAYSRRDHKLVVNSSQVCGSNGRYPSPLFHDVIRQSTLGRDLRKALDACKVRVDVDVAYLTDCRDELKFSANIPQDGCKVDISKYKEILFYADIPTSDPLSVGFRSSKLVLAGSCLNGMSIPKALLTKTKYVLANNAQVSRTEAREIIKSARETAVEMRLFVADHKRLTKELVGSCLERVKSCASIDGRSPASAEAELLREISNMSIDLNSLKQRTYNSQKTLSESADFLDGQKRKLRMELIAAFENTIREGKNVWWKKASEKDVRMASARCVSQYSQCLKLQSPGLAPAASQSVR